MFYMQLYKDLLRPTVEEEKRRCKLKRLVQSPNSYFMDVKCPGGSSAHTVCVVAGLSIKCEVRKCENGQRIKCEVVLTVYTF